AGCDGFTAQGCSFKDQVLTPGHDGYEAIQFDILHPKHVVNCRAEDLNCKNILVENCTFDNVPRAVGTHTGILNNPFDGIIIRGNTFRNLKSIAIQGMNWINVDIRSNTIDTAPRGITVYSVMDDGSGIFKSSDLSSMGGTTSHVSSAYQTPQKANINIAYNTLKNVGSLRDSYADYESQGIAVLGNKLTQVYGKDSDGSGGLPKGDYYNDTVRIHDNLLDVRGNGIRVEDARNTSVTSNEILCSKNTARPANYYGIVLRDNARLDEISFNTIRNAEVNGMQLVDSAVSDINYNEVITTGKYGIAAYNTALGKMTDNYVSSTKQQGIILLDASSASSVKWNRVKNCSGAGLYFTSDSACGEVKSNMTWRCGGNISYSSGSGKVKVGSNYTSPSALTKFYLTESGVKMGVGTAYKIVPDVRPVNTNPTFSYYSSNASVASVDSYGRITANKAGNAVITVSSDNGVKQNYPVEVTASGDVSYLKPQELATPKITKCESIAQGVKITWNAVAGAYGYRVFYKGASGWKGMDNVTTNSYVDTDVRNGGTYTYTVRCVDSNGNFVSGYDNTGFSYTYQYQIPQLATPKITKCESTAQGVKISWNAITGAYGYRVFYKGASGWKGMDNVTTNSYVDTDV
ncbi:MAG: right-handed parallel beta-helix repeat-containing protein, partial [Ruminococcus sp.]|nr:right-handed parallel beta-helix repeat-containing protein [Ruminococcus sp.]